MRLLLIGMLLAGFGANAMDAQTKTPGPLASYKSFKCSFPTYATARWTDPPQASVASQTLTFGISGIDAKKRQASIVGSTVTVQTLALHASHPAAKPGQSELTVQAIPVDPTPRSNAFWVWQVLQVSPFFRWPPC